MNAKTDRTDRIHARVSVVPGKPLYPAADRPAVQYAGMPQKIQCLNCGFRGCDTSRDVLCPRCRSDNYRARKVSGF